ncbi:MAG: peptidoglycan DD-metalloendopeptidase family protein [Rikenellaceae bacterium]
MRFILIIFFNLLCFSTLAQNIEDLRKEISKAEQEIKINTKLLENNQKNQKLNLTQLKLIQSRISSRKKIISSLQSQIKIVNQDITAKNKHITSLHTQIKQLKGEYSALLYTSYKNYKLNNFLVFLFAAEDFNDVTRRVSFMKRYNKLREDKAIKIDSISVSLSKEITALDKRLVELSELKTSHGKELNNMADDERKYKSNAATLKSSASKISKQVKAQQAQIQQAQAQIQKIIAEEARKAKERSLKQSEAEKQIDIKLTGEFGQNKGKLPYPLRGGVITDAFGVHAHPTQKGLTVNNKGINISGERGASVHCVFEGVVTRVFFFKGLNNNVMVRHGNYITVYSNLASVDVKNGDKVSINQILGKIADSDNSDDCMLHFEIWKETTNLNPTSWLRR